VPERIVVVLVLGTVAVVVAAVLRRWGRPDAPTRPTWAVPDQIDRGDFDRPDVPWLVVVFSSSTCTACRGTWEKARQLASDEVAVQDLDSVADAGLHSRYGVDVVPMVLLVGPDGAVRSSFLGEPPTAELWAAMASAREATDG